MEQWKPVVGYESFYQVSNLGRVKSFARIWLCGQNNKTEKHNPERIMKLTNTNHGYLCIMLTDRNTKIGKQQVHRLVAEAFIPNPENKPHVNHIDHDRKNNKLDNLEWCTIAENNKHSRYYKIQPELYSDIIKMYVYDKLLVSKIAIYYNISELTIYKILKRSNIKLRDRSEFYIPSSKRKKVKCIDTGIVYESVRDAQDKLDIHYVSIAKVCRGLFKQVKGLKFEYV